MSARDPAKPLAAAVLMGVLLARGLASETELLDALTEAALILAPQRCRLGMRMRLAHALHDARDEAARERRAVARAVRRVTAAMAALWATRPQIERAVAEETAAAVGRHVVTTAETAALCERTIAEAMHPAAIRHARRRKG